MKEVGISQKSPQGHRLVRMELVAQTQDHLHLKAPHKWCMDNKLSLISKRKIPQLTILRAFILKQINGDTKIHIMTNIMPKEDTINNIHTKCMEGTKQKNLPRKQTKY